MVSTPRKQEVISVCAFVRVLLAITSECLNCSQLGAMLLFGHPSQAFWFGHPSQTPRPLVVLLLWCRRMQNRKEKLRKQQKAHHINLGKGATWEEKPLHQKRKKEGGSVRIRRVAGRQASRPLLIGFKVGRMLKRTSGLNKLRGIVHRMSMELESKFLDTL